MRSQIITIRSLVSGLSQETIKLFKETRDYFFSSPEAKFEQLALERGFNTLCSSKSLDLSKVRLKYAPDECRVRSYE